MAARRCSTCGIDWPLAYHGNCRVCGEATSYIGNAEAITARDASHADFERWLKAETPQARTSRRAKYAREQKAKDEQLAVLEQQLERPSTPKR